MSQSQSTLLDVPPPPGDIIARFFPSYVNTMRGEFVHGHACPSDVMRDLAVYMNPVSPAHGTLVEVAEWGGVLVRATVLSRDTSGDGDPFPRHGGLCRRGDVVLMFSGFLVRVNRFNSPSPPRVRRSQGRIWAM